MDRSQSVVAVESVGRSVGGSGDGPRVRRIDRGDGAQTDTATTAYPSVFPHATKCPTNSDLPIYQSDPPEKRVKHATCIVDAHSKERLLPDVNTCVCVRS
eukprot:GHVU01117557.1.p3 GENE.GHVU01117557.1~~GHVU01117557.1.p3  ORF type:complete len:100 (-),score=6.13 GHVU01117557.1:670-969(-)